LVGGKRKKKQECKGEYVSDWAGERNRMTGAIEGGVHGQLGICEKGDHEVLDRTRWRGKKTPQFPMKDPRVPEKKGKRSREREGQ